MKLPLRPGLVIGLGVAAGLVIGSLLAINPPFGLAGLGAAAYAPTVLLNLPLGVSLWIPLVFVDAVPFVGLASTGALALIVIAWLSVVPARREALKEIARAHTGLLWGLGLLTAWATLSITWSRDTAAAADYVIGWYLALAAFLMVATTITKPNHLVNVVLAFVAGALLATTVGFAPVDLGATARQEGRIAGGLGDPNYLAAGLLLALALAGGLSVTTRNKALRLLLLGAIAYMLVGLAATGSRGGLLAAVVAVATAVIVVPSGKLRGGVIVATVLAAAGIWLAAGSSGTLERFQEVDTGGTGRVDLWGIAWQMSEDHPMTGVGVNNFRAVSADYVREPGGPIDIELISERPHVVHNIYLQQLAETGIVGLVLLLTVVGIALRTTWQATKRLEAVAATRLANMGRSIFVAQVGTLSASLFLSNAYSPLIWILLALSPALTTIARQAELSQEAAK